MQPENSDAAIGSPQFWKQPFRVPASSDPDTATAQTIHIMCGHVRAAAGDDAVKQAAAGAAQQFALLAGGRSGDLAHAAWWWCKLYVKFVHHEFIIQKRIGESGHLQGLISPEVLVRMERPEGDCAIFSECIAAFLTVFGVPFEFVTVAVNPDEPEIFSHVYVYAVLPDGSRLPLDASHGQYPGWQVPSSRVSRRQVWDASGNPVPDRGSRFDGLHAYGLRGGRGLGTMVCDDVGNCWDDGTGTTDAATPITPVTGNSTTYLDYTTGFPVAAGQYVTPTGATYSGTAYTAPSTNNSVAWANFATAMGKAGFTLAEINSIQPGTVVSANGAILRQNPGYAVGTPTSSLNLGTGSISTTTLLIGGAVLFAVMMMGKR